MRELQVSGYDAENDVILLNDPETDDTFAVPANDQLRAAARGDVPGLRQVKVDSSPAMRPSHIQELIRGGASPDDLADKVGIQRSRLDNLARPILMERANMVSRAQQSHPILPNGPAEITLAMAVHTGLNAQGVSYQEATWDSWKTADGHWIVELRWEAGHADNTAHWRFQQDRSYSVSSPIDEMATDLTDPETALRRPSRVAPISHLGEARLRNSRTSDEDRRHLAVAAQRDAAGLPDSSTPGSVRRRPTGYTQSTTVSMTDITAATVPHIGTPDPRDTKPPVDSTAETQQLSLANIPVAGGPHISSLADAPHHQRPPASPPSGPSAVGTPPPPTTKEAATDTPRKGRKKPAMPSWEDVLLGVRGQKND